MALHRHLSSPPLATSSSSAGDPSTESVLDGSASNSNANFSSSSSTCAPITTARPAFTTSLSDFALPPRSSSPGPFARRNATGTATAGPQTAHGRYSAGGGYHLRPRSNLSRSVIVAGQEDEEGQEHEGDDEDSGREGSARRNNTTLQSSLSDVSSIPPLKLGASSQHTNNQQSADGHQSMLREEEDDSETSASLRAFRASTSPQIARTINAGYAARMGSLPPLSPKALKLPYYPRASDSRPKYRTRKDGNSTSPVSRNFADDVGHEQIGDLDLDVDVELDLDGMDMKMTDTDRGSPGPSSPTVAMSPSLGSPTHRQSSRFSHQRTPIRPSTFESIDEEARQADREDNGQSTLGSSNTDLMDTQSTGFTSVQRFPPSSRSTSPTHSRKPTPLAGPLPPSLKRVLYSMRDESEPSQLEIASEAKVTRKLSSAQQAAEVEARRLNVVARRTSNNVEEQTGWMASHLDGTVSSADNSRVSASRATSPSMPWLRATGSSVTTSVSEARNRSTAFSGGVASDFSEEHLLDDVGFESDGLTSSDDSEFLSTAGSGTLAHQGPPHGDDDDMRISDDEMVAAEDDSPKRRGKSQDYLTGGQLGLGIRETGCLSGDVAAFSPPLAVWQSRENGGSAQMGQRDGASTDYTSSAALHSSSLSTTPTQAPPGPSIGQSSSVHQSKKRSSSAAWTNFRNSPSATSSSHHHHHPLRGSPNASLDKRHLHRLQHGPYHRGGGHGSGSSRLSTSPAAAAARSMSGYKAGGVGVGGPLQSPKLIASGGASQKRKFGASTPTMDGDTSLSPGTRGLLEYSHRSSVGGSSPPSGGGIFKRRRAGSPLSGVSTGGGYFALPMTSSSSSTTSSACPSPLLFSTTALSPTLSTATPTPSTTTTATPMGHGGG